MGERYEIHAKHKRKSPFLGALISLYYFIVSAYSNATSYIWTHKLLPVIPQYGLEHSQLLKMRPNQALYDTFITLLPDFPPPCRAANFLHNDIPHFLFPKNGPPGYPLLIILKPTLPMKTGPNTYNTTAHLSGMDYMGDDFAYMLTRFLINESWTTYKTYAFGSDDLLPLSKQPEEIYGLGTTLVDSLDTLWLAGFYDEFYDASEWVDNILGNFNKCTGPRSFFEITIRVFGGLISAYCLSGWPSLLKAAHEMGRRYKKPLLNRFYHQNINLCEEKSQGKIKTIAEFGTNSLEFRTLYFLTGDESYLKISDLHYERMMELTSHFNHTNTYVPLDNIENGVLTIGASTDSYIEYLIKNYLHTDKTEPYFYSLWHGAMDEINSLLLRRSYGPNGFYFLDDLVLLPVIEDLFPDKQNLFKFLEENLEEVLLDFIQNLSDFPAEYFSSLNPRFGINRKSQVEYFSELKEFLKAIQYKQKLICVSEKDHKVKALIPALQKFRFTDVCPVQSLIETSCSSLLDFDNFSEKAIFYYKRIKSKHDFWDFVHFISSYLIYKDHISSIKLSPTFIGTTKNPHSNGTIEVEPDPPDESAFLKKYCRCTCDDKTPLVQCLGLKTKYKNKMQHLACFVGGMLLLGSYMGDIPKQDARWLDQAGQIIKTCSASYIDSPYSLGPEIFSLNMDPNKSLDFDFNNSINQYHLRPELIESFYYLDYFTNNSGIKKTSYSILQSIIQNCNSGGCYSSIESSKENNYELKLMDKMESFWIAETLKYFLLLFSPHRLINLNDWILNTEAHPFPILKGGIPQGANTFIDASQKIWEPITFYPL